MISHVALYRFKDQMSVEKMDDFEAALRQATLRTELHCRLTSGRHVTLPADEAVPEAVFSFAAVWEFPTLAELDAFSRHPAIVEFERGWAKPLVGELAIANHEQEDRFLAEKGDDHAAA